MGRCGRYGMAVHLYLHLSMQLVHNKRKILSQMANCTRYSIILHQFRKDGYGTLMGSLSCLSSLISSLSRLITFYQNFIILKHIVHILTNIIDKHN